MLKTLTFSLSLAVALGFCSMSKAGGLDPNCTTCGLASPQGGVYPTGQGVACGTGCETPCAPKKHCFSFHMPKICLPKISCPKLVHTTSYEWVLKKKHCFSIAHAPKSPCGGDPLRLVLARSMRLARVALLRLARASLLLPARLLTPPAGLRCWPACFPACPVRDHRLGHRDDPCGPWR